MRKYFNTILVIVICALSTASLLWLRLDVEKHASGFVGDQEYRRGEVVRADEIELLKFGGVEIWMDENTEVKLVDGREGLIAINVVQGRVVVKGSLTIETRELKTVIDGTTSFVHYSWEDRIEIAGIDGRTYLHRIDEQLDLSSQALSTTTLEPFVDEYIEFDPTKSSATVFYDQALK